MTTMNEPKRRIPDVLKGQTYASNLYTGSHCEEQSRVGCETASLEPQFHEEEKYGFTLRRTESCGVSSCDKTNT